MRPLNLTAPVKICHLSTVHKRYDTRIYVKECRTLAERGYEVHLVVADGLGFEYKKGINIHDIGRPTGKLKRMLFFSGKIYKMAMTINAEIYHFHDPELLRIGNKLMKMGKKVIYDAHEDVPRQILTKTYIPQNVASLVSKLFERYENKITSKLSGIITATPFIRERFLKRNPIVVDIQNFPFIDEFTLMDENILAKKKNTVCYVGSITKVRGILTIIDALEFCENTKLLLGGKFVTEELRQQAIQSKGWKNVIELGFLDREAVSETLKKSFAGLVVLEPTRSYLDSIPVKMFEYMASSIPVIASDFPYWRQLIGEEGCALFVDPMNPKAIADAITTLGNDSKLAEQMGIRGRKAVLEKFNWDKEESKLLGFYQTILNG